MSPTLIVLPEAKEDMREARRWYDRQRKGLGKKFLAAVKDSFAEVEAMPRRFLEVRPGVRRCLVKTFPYAIYFLVSHVELVVLVVIHTSRDPRTWQNRIDEYLREN